MGYYQLFDSNQRQSLASLYRDKSTLSFEGTQFTGAQKITEKLTNLQFTSSTHQIKNMVVHPSGWDKYNGLLVVVTGDLKVDGGDNALKFSQIFNLIQEGTSWWVYDDVFRLN